MGMLRLISPIAVLACSASLCGAAESVDFYKGKQVSLILSAGEGGGYGSYARIRAISATLACAQDQRNLFAFIEINTLGGAAKRCAACQNGNWRNET